MTLKKKSIYICLVMVMLSITGAFWVYLKMDGDIKDVWLALITGIFGSSFASLSIFLAEYYSERERLVNSVFNKGVRLCESLPLFRCSTSLNEIENYLFGKEYIKRQSKRVVDCMSEEDKFVYAISRYTDDFLEIDYQGLTEFLNDIECFNFLICRKSNERIVEKFSPVYTVLFSKPGMEDGYLFRVFKQFQRKEFGDAATIYSFIKELNPLLYGSVGNDLWPSSCAPNFVNYLHETLWIFRAAFSIDNNDFFDQIEAKKAFMGKGDYTKIR